VVNHLYDNQGHEPEEPRVKHVMNPVVRAPSGELRELDPEELEKTEAEVKELLGYDPQTAPRPNPKDVLGRAKPPLHFIPAIALFHLGMGMEEGGEKYGPFNWRDHPVIASVYYDAALRHIMSWSEGEDFDPKTGVHHFGNAMACMAIILDAERQGKLIDDRPKAPEGKRIGDFIREMVEKRVDRTPHGTKEAERLDRLTTETKTNGRK